MEMKEDAKSWIRRTSFSHTVFHRLDSSIFGAVSLNPQSSGLKASPGPGASSSEPKVVHDDFLIQTAAASSTQKHTNGNLQIQPAVACSDRKSVSIGSQVQRNPLTNKQRSVSPLPHVAVSESFKEARSEKKRFSTPCPRRIQSEKGMKANSFRKDSCNSKASKSDASNSSPLSHFGTLKIGDNSRIRKDSAWYKIFDHAGGKVSNIEAADEHTIDMSQLFLGAKFAHGAHSRLYHGMYKDEPVAVKIINIPDDDENRDLATKLEQQSNREITLLSRFHHRNVIKFVAACKKAPVYCVITEYLSEGSLRSYLHKLDQKSLPLGKLVEIALDIARGMEYIHSQGVIHRDLKPENVLIDQDFHMKIADFGIACEVAYCDLLADDQGTYRWMAPEMIKRRSYGRKVDVYSYGLILWELIAGTIPYEDMSPIQAAFAVVNKNLRPVIPSFCPLALQALIEQCWSLQPDKRPDFSQIVKVLEQFEISVHRDGTLSLSQNPCCQDHKKKVLQWIQKIAAHPNPNTGAVPKPKFM